MSEPTRVVIADHDTDEVWHVVYEGSENLPREITTRPFTRAVAEGIYECFAGLYGGENVRMVPARTVCHQQKALPL